MFVLTVAPDCPETSPSDVFASNANHLPLEHSWEGIAGLFPSDANQYSLEHSWEGFSAMCPSNANQLSLEPFWERFTGTDPSINRTGFENVFTALNGCPPSPFRPLGEHASAMFDSHQFPDNQNTNMLSKGQCSYLSHSDVATSFHAM